MSREYNIKYRRVIYKKKKKRVNIRLLLLIISLIVLVSSAVFFIYNYNKISSQVSGTGKSFLGVSNSVYNSIAKIIGFTVDETISEPEPAEQISTEQSAEEIPLPEEPAPEEQTQEQQIVEEPPAEQETKIIEENETQITEQPTEPTAEETNITIPEEIVNETIENATEINRTQEFTNITIPVVNITIPEIITNLTTENITEVNKTFVNETAITENITALNITTKQYKAVINRPVKWIKKIKFNETQIRDLSIEIPKQAENISIKTGEEILQAEQESDDYEKIINRNKKEIADMTITGFVVNDIENSRGILTRFWNWLISFTITGNVINEIDLENSGGITETSNEKIIDLSEAATQTLETSITGEEDIAIEYYTQAPISNEENITRGKRVIISGPDELNYTDVLAYTLLDNKISINNSDKIKVYWIKEEAGQTQEQTTTEETTELNETQAEVTEIINETELINNKTAGEEEQAIEEQITNETAQPITNEIASEQQASPITALAIDEQNLDDNEINNLTDNQLLENNISEREASQTQTILTRTTKEQVNFTAYDLDEDGMIDYVEWNVPHLSNQTYEIIYITKAEHLDENYTFVENVYEQVREKDDNWTLIPDENYLRVTFEKPLDKTKDITIYARAKDSCSDSENENNSVIINGTEVPCDIYQKKKRIDEIRRLLEE